MPIASLAPAVLSAAAVGILLWLLRRAGARAAGLAAAVPINSLPALFWLAERQGSAFAASPRSAPSPGTALTVVFGTAFAASSKRAGRSAPRRITPRRRAARGAGRCAGPPAAGDATLLSMATAGAMSLLVSELARHAGPQACGLVAAIPVIGLLATRAGWRRGGVAAMLEVVRGYLDGMAAKAAFLATLGAAVDARRRWLGLAARLAAAVLALHARRPRREGTTTAPPRRARSMPGRRHLVAGEPRRRERAVRAVAPEAPAPMSGPRSPGSPSPRRPTSRCCATSSPTRGSWRPRRPHRRRVLGAPAGRWRRRAGRGAAGARRRRPRRRAALLREIENDS
jgi:hypothetical protein